MENAFNNILQLTKKFKSCHYRTIDVVNIIKDLNSEELHNISSKLYTVYKENESDIDNKTNKIIIELKTIITSIEAYKSIKEK